MRYIALSRFHPHHGPEITIIIPELLDTWVQEQIVRTLDILDNPGFFTQQYTSNDQFWEIANLYFEVTDPKARGGVQMALLSLILTDEDISTYIFQNDLYKLADVLGSNHYFAQLLAGTLDKETEIKIFSESKDIILAWLDSLPKTISPLDHKGISLFFCGFTHAGKSSLIKHLKEGRFLPTMPGLGVDVVKALIEGIQYIAIDIPQKKQHYFRDSWKQWLKFSDILVLVIDATAAEQFMEAKEFLGELLTKTTPLAILVLCTKSDEANALSTMRIKKSLKLETLEGYTNKISVIATSAKTGLGLSDTFGKIIEIHMSLQQTNENKDQILYMIMAQWHEDTGPHITDFYPKPFPNDISKDELVSQVFTIGMNIFGKTIFKNNIISIPFLQQKLRSRLFFNAKSSAFSDENENYFLGVFADLVTTNENIFGQFESKISHFMHTEFLNARIDLYPLYNTLTTLLAEKKHVIKKLSVFNQYWLVLFQRKPDHAMNNLSVLWKFGSLNDEMITKIKHFVLLYTTSNSSATELSTTDILIRYRKSVESFLSDIEIFLSAFDNSYVLIGTNIPVSAALIKQVIVGPSPAVDLTKNILSAHIMSKYAELFSNPLSIPNTLIDRIFEDAFIEMDIEPTRTIYAKDGNCNLSDLQLAELLYLHRYLIQRITRDHVVQYENNFYASIIKMSTKVLKFYYKIDKNTAQLIHNQVLVLIELYTYLFGYIPEKIFIQTNADQQLYYDQQSDLLLLLNCPEKILLEEAFFKKLTRQKTIKKDVVERLVKEVVMLALNQYVHNTNDPSYIDIWKSFQTIKPKK